MSMKIKECNEQLTSLKNNSRNLLCCICMTEQVDVILQPCNHVSICSTCCLHTFHPARYTNTNLIGLNRNTTLSENNISVLVRGECPNCKRNVTKYSKIFIN